MAQSALIQNFEIENASDLERIKLENKPLSEVVSKVLAFVDERLSGKSPSFPSTTKVPLDYIKIIYNEGTIVLDDTIYKSWEDATNAFKLVYDDYVKSGQLGYNKVKVEFAWTSGNKKTMRIDVSANDGDYSPIVQPLGQYVKNERNGNFTDEQLEELDFGEDAKVVVPPSVEVSEPIIEKVADANANEQLSKKELQDKKEFVKEQIKALKFSLKYANDDIQKQQISEEIIALKSLLKFI